MATFAYQTTLTFFAPGLLFTFYILPHIYKEQICANPFFHPVSDCRLCAVMSNYRSKQLAGKCEQTRQNELN